MDRNGRVLVQNRPSFNIELVTEDSPDPFSTATELARLLNLDSEELAQKIRHQRRRHAFEPKLLLKDVSRDVVARVASRKYMLPGIVINVEPTREYLYGDMAAHVLGYIREITKGQIEEPRFAGYREGEMVGQFGVESRWESYLHGKRGIQYLSVNALGVKMEESSFEPELPGHSLTLTLDFDMQRAADEALKDKKGAVVALDPGNGEILVMASSPRFDPNMFTSEIPVDVWRDLVAGPERRLNNRAVQGAYPPGSVYKVFMAVATLAEGVAKPHDHVHCPGFLHFGNRDYGCHKKSGHGAVDLFNALVMSCDVYFYTMGQRLGVDRIHKYAQAFGFGSETGLELVEENPGIIPSTEWKKNYFRDPAQQKWFPGETLSVSIGQGATTTTPLQVARGLAALVNGGIVWRPHLVRAIGRKDGAYFDDNFPPQEVGRVEVDGAILKTVQEALVGVVNDPRGTGRRAQLSNKNVKVGGKTGTAQVVALDSHLAKVHNDHAWFAGFAPAEDPQVVVVALIENGGHGGVAAAPVVRQVLEARFGSSVVESAPHPDGANEGVED